MNNIMDNFEKQKIRELTAKKNIPNFRAGDTIKVNVKVVEGQRSRIQAFEGICIAKKNAGLSSSCTVRKVSYGEGIERIFPFFSNIVDSIEVIKQGDVRRAKLYYLRKRSGKSTRIADKNRGDEKDQYEGISIVQPALDEIFLLIIDDWNLSEVRKWTNGAIKDLAISPEVNESYVFKNSKFGIKKIFKSFYKISGWSFKNYNRYFSGELGEDLFFKPLFNNGVFCLKSDSKIWNLLKIEYQNALNKAKSSYGIKTDQLSLNKVIYENFNKVSILDSCDWPHPE